MPTENSYGFGKMSSVIDRWKPEFLFRRRLSLPRASESWVRRTVALKGILADTTSWVRILEDGRIEVEYYERNAGAEDHFGGDVAWIYRISAAERSHLYERLQKHTHTAITDDRTLVNTFVNNFKDAWALRDWLKQQQIPFDGEFDSWP